jgi:two-component system sensor histidine kinase KdpD
MVNKRKILVCISEKSNSLKLIRYANQNFGAKNSDIYVLFVETEKTQNFTESQNLSLQKNIKKVEELGFKFYSVTANSISEGITKFAEDFDIDITIVGNTNSYRNKKLKNRILDSSRSELLVLKIKNNKSKASLLKSLNFRFLSFKNLLFSCFIIAIITIIDLVLIHKTPLGPSLTHYHISMLYILAIVYLSIKYGSAIGILSSIISSFTISFFFSHPIYSFSMHNITDYHNHIFFIVLACITSIFGGYSKVREDRLRKREFDNQHILKFANNLTGISKAENLSKHIKDELENIFNTEVFIILANQKKDGLNIPIYLKNKLSDDEIVGLNLCYREKESQGKFTDNSIKDSNFIFLSIHTQKENIGVIAISLEFMEDFKNYDMRLINSFTDISANAFERAILSERVEEAVKNEDREKLRADLLSSVSHDLKTPLASIIGSLTAMEHMKDSLDEDAIEVLRKTAVEEAERLNQFITNILDMTKIESGSIKLDKKLRDPDTIILKVLKHMRHRTAEHEIKYQPTNKNIKINVDSLLLEQVLQNLIDNAVKYSEKNSLITINTYEVEDKFVIEVKDEGYGIDDEMKELIFDKFERIKMVDKKVAGTGLGLAICKSIVEHMGSSIKVEDNIDDETGQRKGTIFKLVF